MPTPGIWGARFESASPALVYIAYRREHADLVARIREQLTARLDGNVVYDDDDDLVPPDKLLRHRLDRLSRSRVVLAIIDGSKLALSRLREPADFMRAELEAAHELGIPIVPVLVPGARMLHEEELRFFGPREAVIIEDGPEFTRSVDRLGDIITPIFPKVSAMPSSGVNPLGGVQVASDDAPTTQRSSIEGRKPLPRDVQVSIYRPTLVAPERWYALAAFVHAAEKSPDDPDGTPDPLEEVARRARALLGDAFDRYRATTQEAEMALPPGGQVTLVPEVPGVTFNPPSRSFAWHETVHEEVFRLSADRSLDGTTTRGRISAYFGPLLLAEVVISFRVDSSAGAEKPPNEVARARAYRKVFASYSREDREMVALFEEVASSLGDRYLIDVQSLRAGEVWSDGLEQLIDGADVFQLFWSQRSMYSQFCRREWQHALALGRDHFVRPVFWEHPMPRDDAAGLPPPDLAALHFAHFGRRPEPSLHVPKARLDYEKEAKESSVLFSLKELMSLEEARIEDGVATEEHIRREKVERARADEVVLREAEERRVRVEEERRRAEENVRREEVARLEALRSMELERARAEAEHRARMEALMAQQAHDRALIVLGSVGTSTGLPHRDRGGLSAETSSDMGSERAERLATKGTKFRWVALCAAVACAAALGLFWKVHRDELEERSLAELKAQLAAAEYRSLLAKFEEADQRERELAQALAEATDEALKRDLEQELAAARKRTTAARESARAACKCPPDDPLCSCL